MNRCSKKYAFSPCGECSASEQCANPNLCWTPQNMKNCVILQEVPCFDSCPRTSWISTLFKRSLLTFKNWCHRSEEHYFIPRVVTIDRSVKQIIEFWEDPPKNRSHKKNTAMWEQLCGEKNALKRKITISSIGFNVQRLTFI